MGELVWLNKIYPYRLPDPPDEKKNSFLKPAG
jgi:hypothetical protein